MHAAPALPELQRRFLAALYDESEPGPIEAIAGNGLEPSARLRIYRRSCSETQMGTLRTTYPAILTLVGDKFFDQTAHGYRSHYPSGSGNLQGFGAQFADYLQSLPAARELPYLPDAARLEWQRQQTALAADAEPIPPDVFARVLTDTDAPVRLGLHPSLHWLASRYPVLTIWGYATTPTSERLTLPEHGENVVLWRDKSEVAMAEVNAASLACIEALARGDSLDDAQAAADRVDTNFDLPACVGSLAERGLITTLKHSAL
ncbi:MAG: HvfC/BufC family peptide modification chaperone [Gammaproteobacteria bacterium]